MLTSTEIDALMQHPKRVGLISRFETEAEANQYAAIAHLTLLRYLEVTVLPDPDTGTYMVLQSMAYLRRKHDQAYEITDDDKARSS